MADILVLCTANMCRSVMAEALLGRRLIRVGAVASVRSAGMLRAGEPPVPEVVSALAALGLDVSAHRSRRICEHDLAGADLVITMAREQLRHAVVTAPQTWPRAFTLKELLRRGQLVGNRPPGQRLADWLPLPPAHRPPSGPLRGCIAEDVADPIGGEPEAYLATALQIDHLLGQLVDLAWGG